MLTDLIDHLDTLITEQRPISELKPRLGFLRDQAEALERRVSTLEFEKQNDPLPAENDRLRADLQDARDQIEKLARKPGGFTAEFVPMKPSSRDLKGLL